MTANASDYVDEITFAYLMSCVHINRKFLPFRNTLAYNKFLRNICGINWIVLNVNKKRS